MEASELRIGNWIGENALDLNTNEYFVMPIKVNGNIIKVIEFCNGKHVFSPIPLSPELLEKCGFENTIGNSYEIDKVRIWFDDSGVYFFFDRSIRIIISSLHQLQNLYFALTNEELKITL